MGRVQFLILCMASVLVGCVTTPDARVPTPSQNTQSSTTGNNDPVNNNPSDPLDPPADPEPAVPKAPTFSGGNQNAIKFTGALGAVTAGKPSIIVHGATGYTDVALRIMTNPVITMNGAPKIDYNNNPNDPKFTWSYDLPNDPRLSVGTNVEVRFLWNCTSEGCLEGSGAYFVGNSTMTVN